MQNITTDVEYPRSQHFLFAGVQRRSSSGLVVDLPLLEWRHRECPQATGTAAWNRADQYIIRHPTFFGLLICGGNAVESRIAVSSEVVERQRCLRDVWLLVDHLGTHFALSSQFGLGQRINISDGQF